MRSFGLLQTATGGSELLVVLALFGLVVTAGASLVVAYVIARGYRRNRDPARLWLAVGLVLLATGPIVLQFVLTNAAVGTDVVRSAVANASKLLGLGAILYAIYGVPRRHVPEDERETERPNDDAGGVKK
ncbi:DUF5985 family protein [Natronorubrum sp. FCH18a]|uniref:DUF5985 family protein n=1 Tax=Natronorubrum sp. FCH18a TaxID=3447018 RepID=UPI003F51774A